MPSRNFKRKIIWRDLEELHQPKEVNDTSKNKWEWKLWRCNVVTSRKQKSAKQSQCFDGGNSYKATEFMDSKDNLKGWLSLRNHEFSWVLCINWYKEWSKAFLYNTEHSATALVVCNSHFSLQLIVDWMWPRLTRTICNAGWCWLLKTAKMDCVVYWILNKVLHCGLQLTSWES